MASEFGHMLLKRSDSYELLPPYMSMLRLVLLGNSWRQRCSVGNLLLDSNVFDAKKEPKTSQHTGPLQDKSISVINTPDLLQPDFTEDTLTQLIEELSEACAPGPHVFLLVLQPEDFTETHNTRLQSVLERLSEQAFDHSLVIISAPREERPGYMEEYMNDSCLKDVITKCRYRYLWMNIREHQRNLKRIDLLKAIPFSLMNTTEHDVSLKFFKHKELLTRICQIVKENNGEHVRSMSSLNLVLCGARETEKTSAVEAILGVSLPLALSPEQCGKHQGEVCGRWVSVVELPALSGKPLEAVMQQCLSCISLCGPEGVHAFILVLPVGPLTDEDKAELKTIQDTFSSPVNLFTMILFTVDSDPTAPAVVHFVKGDRDIQELIKSCGGGSLIFNTRDRQQGREILENVERMKSKNDPHSYTTETLLQAQIERITTLHKEICEIKPKSIVKCKCYCFKVNNDLNNDICDDAGDANLSLRIVLIGKTGSGKSSSGNTILGRREFTAIPSQTSVTKVCQKEQSTVDGRLVAVVDTPGLFDTTMSHDEVNEEMLRCVSLLAPGPHVFVLVLQIGRLTEEEKETLKLVKHAFGKDAEKFTIILFTHGDQLTHYEMSIEEYIKNCCDNSFKKLISDCGNRYHMFSNHSDNNQTQVIELMEKIEDMVMENGGGCYTNDMLLKAETSIKKETERIMKEKEEEMRKERENMETKYQQEIEEIKQKMDKQKADFEIDLNEKEKKIYVEQELRKKEQEKRGEEEKKRKEEEEIQTQEWEEKRRQLEEQIRLRQTSKETADRELQESRKQMDQERKQQKQENEQREREMREEDRKRKEKEEKQRLEWERKRKDLEKKIKAEEKSKETIRNELQESRRQMELEREKWEKEQQENEKKIQQKRQDEERKRKEQEEILQQEWEQQRKDLEEKIKSEEESKEAIDRKLQESRREMEEEREQWENERKEWWEKREQENKERRQKEQRKQEEYEQQRAMFNKKLEKHQMKMKQKEKERQKLEEDHKKQVDELKRTYEEQARKQAEEHNEFIKLYETQIQDKDEKYDLLKALSDHNERTKTEEHQKEFYKAVKALWNQSTWRQVLGAFGWQSNLSRINELVTKHEKEIKELETKHEAEMKTVTKKVVRAKKEKQQQEEKESKQKLHEKQLSDLIKELEESQ